MSFSAHSVPNFNTKSSNFEEGEVVYKRATKGIGIKNDGVMSEVEVTSENLERDNSINGYSLGITDDYTAEFRLVPDDESYLRIRIVDKENPSISAEYEFYDKLNNTSVKFVYPPIPTWKRYFDWSNSKQTLLPGAYST